MRALISARHVSLSPNNADDIVLFACLLVYPSLCLQGRQCRGGYWLMGRIEQDNVEKAFSS